MINLNNFPQPEAYICVNKNRKKVAVGKKSNQNKVYLSNQDEYQIELFNPKQVTVLAKIKVEGRNATQGGVILKPGERIFLDCFIDSKKRFKFATYQVEDSTAAKKAIENNGVVDISFYDEKLPTFTTTYTYFNQGITYDTCGTSPTYDTSAGTGGNNYLGYDLITSSSTFNPRGAKLKSTTRSKSIETGKTEEGSNSDMQFKTENKDFNWFSCKTIKFHLLPESRKPVKKQELPKLQTENSNFKPLSVADEIKKLFELHQIGALTKDEFDSQKAKLLA